MKNLYNKILKEALDIMDFDSWDDSEQTFKEKIERGLNGKLFIYYAPSFENLNLFHIDFDYNPYFLSLLEEEEIVLSSDGKKIYTTSDGGKHSSYPFWIKTKYQYRSKVPILIQGLDNPKVYYAKLFCYTNLLETPENFTLAKRPNDKMERLDSMFQGCFHLKIVNKINISTPGADLDHMFEFCENLTNVEMIGGNFIGKPLTMESTFEECFDLSPETIKEWSKIYNFEKQKQRYYE